MTQEQKWLSYVAELRSKHEAEMHEYAKELQGKILDQEFTIKSLAEDNRALTEVIEINCNCNADGCHQSKLLQDKDYQIQEAWEKVHALEDSLHNSETENDTLKRVNESLEKSVKIWEISHNEQRKTFIKFLKRLEKYPTQFPARRNAEIEEMINHYSK